MRRPAQAQHYDAEGSRRRETIYALLRSRAPHHPARAEDLAMRHAGVHQAAASDVGDARLGEKVCRAAIPAPGKRLTAQALLEYLHAAGLSRCDRLGTLPRLAAVPAAAGGKMARRDPAQWA